MGTNYIAPTWRQPKNANKDRLSDYSIQWQDGNLGNIISFQADADSSTNPFLPSTTNSKMSLSAFFNLQGGSGERIIISEKVSGSATHWKLSINTNDQLEFVARTDAGLPYYTTITGGTTISDNSWHHVALAWDGSNFNLYLDGVSDATPVAASTFYYNAAYTSWGDIGGQRYNPNAISNRFSGQLSQICYFDYSLSTDQVTYLSNMNNPMTISGAEPVAYWPLGDNSNPTANAGYPNIVSSADSVFDFTTNGYITLPTVPELGMAGASNYTTNIWINRDSASQEGILGYNYANPNGSGWYLWANGTTLTAQLGYDGGTTAPYGAWKYTIPSADFIGSWHMVTMVFDGSQTGQDRLKVYYDGVEPSGGFYTDANLFPSVLPNGVNADENRNVYLGVLQTGTNPTAGLGPSYLFNGQMSNAEFWKDSLTSAEVLTLYNNGQPLDGGQPEADKLRAWYKLNQSAVLTPGQIAPSFSFSKVGSPDLSGGDCFVENVGGVWQLTSEDMNCDSTNLTEYVVLDSREILGAETSAVVRIDFRWLHIPSSSSTTGVALDVSIDGGAYTNLLNSFGSGSSSLYSPGGGSVFVPGEWPITYSSSAKLRLKIQTGNSNGCDAFVKTLRLTSAGGTILYDANFSDSANQGTGYPSGSTPVQPTSSVVSVDKWEIPDNRSAYPQSFNFDGVADYVELGSLVNLGTVHTISWWEKSDGLDREDFIANPSSSSQIYGPKPSVLFYKAANVSSYMLNGNAEPLNVNLNDDKWHNISIVRNGASLDFYVDGLPQVIGLNALVGTEVFEFNSIMHPTASSRYSKGTISNLAVFTTNLSYPADIKTLYNNGVPLPTASVQPSNLKLWTRLDNSSKWNTTTSQWNIPTNPTTPIPSSISAIVKSSASSYIENTTPSGIDLTNPTTCSFWTKTTQADVAINSGSLGGGGDFAIIGDRILIFRSGTNYRYFDVNTTILNDNNWHNLILYTPGYANADIASTRLFMDGLELTASTTVSSGNPASVNNKPILGVGNVYADITEASFSNAVIWSSDQTANITEIYNNGTPASSYTGNPILWWELNNLTSGLDDLSGNGNNGVAVGPVFTVVEEDIIAYQLGISSGMTEANLIDENVSVVNGESDTLPATALVQSDLTRKLPFSNYSVLFNGIDESFNCGPGFQYTDITVSCWVRFEGMSPNYQRILQTGVSGGGIGFMLALDQSGDGLNKITAGWSNPTEETTRSTVAVSLDTWYNVLFTRNASGIKLYIDGVDVSGPSSAGWGYGSGNNLELGRKPGGGSYLDGDFSNVAIWNSVLTQEEILDVYNNGVPTNLNTSFTPGQPEYWWPMDEDNTYFNGSVLIARDAVGSTDATGDNVIQENIVGNAPGSTANGVGSNLTIADLKGDMQNSTNNSYSINMADYADGITNPADSGRSTNVP